MPSRYDPHDELLRITELHTAGILTDDERRSLEEPLLKEIGIDREAAEHHRFCQSVVTDQGLCDCKESSPAPRGGAAKVLAALAITVLVGVGGLVAIGFAMDAADGSIDAIDDRKWSATSSGGAVGTDPASNNNAAAVNPTLDAKREAYDFGVDLYRSDPTVCTGMTEIHDQAVRYMSGGLDATGFLKETQTWTNEWVTDKATSAGHSAQSRFAVSGFWDEIARDCSEALFDATVAGRP